MKFEVTKDNLVKGLQIVSKLPTSRATLPILGNIFLEADNGQLTLIATDLDLGIETKVNAKVTEAGSITIPSRTLVDYVANNHDKTINFALNDVTLDAVSEHTKVKIKGMEATDFPSIPVIKGGVEFSVPAPIFKEAILKTAFASTQDETRPVLGGVALFGEKDKLVFVSTDSYRLAEFTVSLNPELKEPVKAVVPSRAMQEVMRLITESTALVEIKMDKQQFAARVDGTLLVSRLIDGAFPDYQAIIPKENKTTVTVNRADLINNLKMVSLFSRDSAYNVTFVVKPKELELRALSSSIGSGVTTVEAAVSGPTMEVAFNARFVLDVLQVLEGESVQIKLSPNQDDRWFPGIIETINEDNYHYVVMPLRSEG